MALKTVNTPDKNLQLVQDYTNDELVPLQSSPLVLGNMLTGVVLTTGQDNLIAHKLGYTPSFWVLARQNTNTNVYESVTNALGGVSVNSSYINLKCGANCTVSLWLR